MGHSDEQSPKTKIRHRITYLIAKVPCLKKAFRKMHLNRLVSRSWIFKRVVYSIAEIRMRLKLEINCKEHFNILGLVDFPFEVWDDNSLTPAI